MRTPSSLSFLGAGVALAILVLPAVVLAGDAASTRNLVLDFERSGVLKDLLAKTLGVAKSFLFLSTFLAYGLEAFGRSPTAERDYGAVTWRLVVVLMLLWNYQAVFGGVIGLLDRVEREVAPASTWKALVARANDMRQALEDLASHGEQAPPPGSTTSEPRSSPPSRLATWTYEALVSIVQLLAEGIVFLINWLSRILTATLFVLGPLALVAGIPRVSRTGTRWFLRLVTIASWPIFSGVLLSVLVSISGQGVQRHSYLECLVAALVMLVTALATPMLASHVIGGALENFAATGFFSALALHHHATRPAWRMVSGNGGGNGEGGRSGAGGSAAGGQGGPSGAPGQTRGARGGVVANGPWGGSGMGRGNGPRGPRRGAPGGAWSSGGEAPPRQPGSAQGGVVANPPSPPSAPRPSGQGPKGPGSGTEPGDSGRR